AADTHAQIRAAVRHVARAVVERVDRVVDQVLRLRRDVRRQLDRAPRLARLEADEIGEARPEPAALLRLVDKPVLLVPTLDVASEVDAPTIRVGSLEAELRIRNAHLGDPALRRSEE